jgi:hypothetical protein
VVDLPRCGEPHPHCFILLNQIGNLRDGDLEARLAKPVNIVGTVAPDVVRLAIEPQAVSRVSHTRIFYRPVRGDGYKEPGPPALLVPDGTRAWLAGRPGRAQGRGCRDHVEGFVRMLNIGNVHSLHRVRVEEIGGQVAAV